MNIENLLLGTAIGDAFGAGVEFQDSILKHSTDAFDALKKSIYLGGDVDSIASITSGIKAARYGLNSLPNFMIENVEGKNYLSKIAKEFRQYLKSKKS